MYLRIKNLMIITGEQYGDKLPVMCKKVHTNRALKISRIPEMYFCPSKLECFPAMFA